ncbi:MAG: type I-B CRISPR-associated protein Cas5b [Aquificota bacterium]|nr:type I-B CRISPR-associated protein Cas5b [Aquificota bacterium]
MLLKFELFSPCATFKAPLSLKGIETYPLPPPSTIIGLLYTAVGRRWEGEKFSLSIQGVYESVFRDYIRMRKYNRKDKELSPLPLEVPRLYNFRALIHVRAERSLLEEFMTALRETLKVSLPRRRGVPCPCQTYQNGGGGPKGGFGGRARHEHLHT